MAEFKPTASQQAAIETRGCPVLVSAGAGSGKTRVLTERLMRYVADADIDSFLIITYTRAAAGELRGRITEELNRRLAADPFFRSQSDNACLRCDYRDACRFEEGRGGEKSRYLPKYSPEEVWALMEEGETNG